MEQMEQLLPPELRTQKDTYVIRSATDARFLEEGGWEVQGLDGLIVYKIAFYLQR